MEQRPHVNTALQESLRNVRSEELLSRFRSKADLYRYLTHQSKHWLRLLTLAVVGLYLPSYETTRLSFIRDVLQDKKKLLKTTELVKINVPRYEELSVKNLYRDAIRDQEVGPYLPNLEQSTNKYPEREFFFNVLGTVNPQYLKHIIEEAEQKRYTGTDERSKSDTIMITGKWLEELHKYPFISSKCLLLTRIERPGKAVYLIKERSRLVRVKKNTTKHEVSLRLGGASGADEDMPDSYANVSKRRKNEDGSASIVQSQSRKSSSIGLNINT